MQRSTESGSPRANSADQKIIFGEKSSTFVDPRFQFLHIPEERSVHEERISVFPGLDSARYETVPNVDKHQVKNNHKLSCTLINAKKRRLLFSRHVDHDRELNISNQSVSKNDATAYSYYQLLKENGLLVLENHKISDNEISKKKSNQCIQMQSMEDIPEDNAVTSSFPAFTVDNSHEQCVRSIDSTSGNLSIGNFKCLVNANICDVKDVTDSEICYNDSMGSEIFHESEIFVSSFVDVDSNEVVNGKYNLERNNIINRSSEKDKGSDVEDLDNDTNVVVVREHAVDDDITLLEVKKKEIDPLAVIDLISDDEQEEILDIARYETVPNVDKHQVKNKHKLSSTLINAKKRRLLTSRPVDNDCELNISNQFVSKNDTIAYSYYQLLKENGLLVLENHKISDTEMNKKKSNQSIQMQSMEDIPEDNAVTSSFPVITVDNSHEQCARSIYSTSENLSIGNFKCLPNANICDVNDVTDSEICYDDSMGSEIFHESEIFVSSFVDVDSNEVVNEKHNLERNNRINCSSEKDKDSDVEDLDNDTNVIVREHAVDDDITLLEVKKKVIEPLAVIDLLSDEEQEEMLNEGNKVNSHKMAEGKNGDPRKSDTKSKELSDYGLPETVVTKLEELFITGKLTFSELDERALEALKDFSVDGALAVLKEFTDSSTEHVSNKSAYLCRIMKSYRQKMKIGTQAVAAKGPNKKKIKATILYASNLTAELTDDKLKEIFESYGEVVRVVKIKDYAYIHFVERDSAVKAVEEVNGKQFGGSTIEVLFSKPSHEKNEAEEVSPNREKQMTQAFGQGGMMDERLPTPPCSRGGRMLPHAPRHFDYYYYGCGGYADGKGWGYGQLCYNFFASPYKNHGYAMPPLPPQGLLQWKKQCNYKHKHKKSKKKKHSKKSKCGKSETGLSKHRQIKKEKKKSKVEVKKEK